jgi:hypothetical protein
MGVVLAEDPVDIILVQDGVAFVSKSSGRRPPLSKKRA